VFGEQIAGILADPAVARAHWGVMVTAMDGTPIYALHGGEFFQPSSNAKLFTSAAALALLGPADRFETRLIGRGHFEGAESLTGDLILQGDGDANISGRTLPYVEPGPQAKTLPLPPLHALEEMADAVAKTGLKVVNGDVVGDDTLFPWEPYPGDWSIDDALWGYGAPVSALTVNDNELKLTVRPGSRPGVPAVAALDPAVPYYTFDTSALTTGAAKSGSHWGIDRPMGSRALRLFGTIAVDASPEQEEVAIEDPAEYAAAALKAMLEVRGIRVTGVARAKHRLPEETEGFLKQTRIPIPGFVVTWNGGASNGGASTLGDGRAHSSGPTSACSDCDPSAHAVDKLLAVHASPSLADDIVMTNKTSQNLHAELLLHQLGNLFGGDGSTAYGARVVRAFLGQAGLDPDDFVFYDGSGLSGHDLVTPRATVALLRYAVGQPWFATYKASLPVGGVDGTLAGRFPKVPLKGQVFAKTGTLGEARALSGYLECASGKTVIFSILDGNHPPGSSADRVAMDKIVAAIWAAN